MAPVPAIQALPQPIVDLIYEYLINSSYRRLSVNESEATVSLGTAVELSHVCRSWRAAVLGSTFRRCHLSLDGGVELRYHVFDADMHVPAHLLGRYAAYASELTVVLDGARAAGSFVRFYAEHAELCFANAHTLHLDVRCSPDAPARLREPTSTLDALAARVQACVPSVRATSVSICGQSLYGQYHSCDPVGTVLRGLFATPAPAAAAMRPAELPWLAAAGDLSCMAVTWGEGAAAVAEAIHANATSLQSLAVYYDSYPALERLVVDGRGRPVTYPYLDALSLVPKAAGAPPPIAAPAVCAPFPRLASLFIGTAYPFADDLPFRGNGSTLAKLRMLCSYRCLRMLVDRRIVHREGLEVLCLEVEEAADGSGAACRVADALGEVVRAVNPRLEKLSIANSSITGAAALLAAECARCTGLQRLEMDHASLAFAEVVAVLGALPSLQTLRSRVSVLGAEFNGKTIAQVAEIVRSRHAPLNGCFREWHIRNQGRLPMNSVLPYAMILADVCPLLRTVAVRREFGGQLQGAVGRLLACGLYADLARRYRLTVRRMARLSVIGIRQLAPAQAVPGMRRTAIALADG